MKSENISKDELCNLVLTQLGLIGQKFNIGIGFKTILINFNLYC